MAQGLEVTNIYHGRCALERRSSVPQRRDSGALVLAHMLRGLILGKSLTDSEPVSSPLRWATVGTAHLFKAPGRRTQREGRRKYCGKWWPQLVLPWLQLSLCWEEAAQAGGGINSQVTPEACDLFVKWK